VSISYEQIVHIQNELGSKDFLQDEYCSIQSKNAFESDTQLIVWKLRGIQRILRKDL